MPDTPEINLARANALNVSNVSTTTDSLLSGKLPSQGYTMTMEGREDGLGGVGKTPCSQPLTRTEAKRRSLVIHWEGQLLVSQYLHDKSLLSCRL